MWQQVIAAVVIAFAVAYIVRRMRGRRTRSSKRPDVDVKRLNRKNR